MSPGFFRSAPGGIETSQPFMFQDTVIPPSSYGLHGLPTCTL